MSTEEKKETSVDQPTTPPASEDKGKDNFDYKAELEKERKLREAKEKELSQAQFKIQQLKKEKVDFDDDDTSTKIDTNKIFELAREEARKEVERAQSGFAKDSLEDALSAASSDPAEIEAIKFHYENSIKQTGYSRTAIFEDIQKAKVLANRVKLEKMESELNKSKQSKATASTGNAGYQETKDSVELSPEEETWIQKASKETGQSVDSIRAKLIANKTRR